MGRQQMALQAVPRRSRASSASWGRGGRDKGRMGTVGVKKWMGGE